MAQTVEERLIDWLRAKVSVRGHVDLLGDDAAFLELSGDWAVTTDQQIAGIHFPADLDAGWLARRLLRVNLSDLAAVGAEPRFAFNTIAGPSPFKFKKFLDALTAETHKFGITLAGGDVASAPFATSSLTLLGKRRSGCRWLKRTAARVADRIWLGGTVGESRLGREILARGGRVEGGRVVLPEFLVPRSNLSAAARRAVRRHLRPVPQLALGEWLSRRRRAAVIDVSDGLVLDLGRLADASAVACAIDAERLPLARHHHELADALAIDSIEAPLGGGEDYVLAFCLPPRVKPPPELAVTEIGVVSTRKTKTRRVEVVGAKTAGSGGDGWDHLARRNPATQAT